MNSNTVTFAVRAILERVGLATSGTLGSDAEGSFCDFLVADAHPNDSFTVRFRLGWRSAEAQFLPGKFSAPLLAQMGRSTTESRETFATFVSALQKRKIRTTMRINGADASPENSDTWPATWSRLELSVRLAPFLPDMANASALEMLVADLVVPLFGMLAALIGVEDNDTQFVGEPEGTPIQSLVTRYERKKINREACIQLKGRRCTVCGFDFSTAYGALGAGYIEVHHTTPVSSIGPDHRINIEKDLEPLCSNCHSMAHRENPPVTMERLRHLITQSRQRSST